MSQMTRFGFTGGVLLALCAAFSGCSSRTNVSATGSTPSQFTHVYITAQAVWFNTKDDASPEDSGWARFPLKTPVTIDLIDESNGTLGELADDLRVAPGTYNTILILPVDWMAAPTTSAQAVGATWNSEADYVDASGNPQQAPLILPNPEKGFVVPGALKVPVGKVGVGGIGGSSSTSTTSTPTTNVFGSPTTSPTTTTTSASSATVTTVSFATSFDANRDLHVFNYTNGTTAATGVLLSANPTASDLSTTGGITGTLTLTNLTNYTNVSSRVAIQASAELMSADGSHHVIVASAPVQTDGTFTIYPLPSNSSTPTVYDVVIHGPTISTIIIKNVSVSTTTPTLTGAASTTGSVATTTATGAVSIGTFIPTAATTFLANITPTAAASLPPGAAATFYQTLPASGEKPYAIDEVGIDSLNLNLQASEPLSAGNIQSGTYASSGSTITVTSSKPGEGTATYQVGATAPLFSDAALTGTLLVASTAASTLPSLSAPAAGTTPPTPVTVSVGPLTPANSSAVGSIAASITAPAGTYSGGELIVSHNGAVIGVAAIPSSALLNGSGSTTVTGLPSGSTGNYYLSVIVWNSSGLKSESVSTTPLTLSGGTDNDVAVTIN